MTAFSAAIPVLILLAAAALLVAGFGTVSLTVLSCERFDSGEVLCARPCLRPVAA